MSSDLRRGALAATALVLSIASLTACGAGNDAQTLEIKPDNAATSVGSIKIQNATVITQPDLKAKGPAVVTAQIFNTGSSAQTLKSVTIGGKATAKLTPAKGEKELVVPAHGSLTIGGKDNAAAVVDSGREAARDGDAQSVAFDFSSTGEVKLDAFVVPATHYFDKWGPEEPPATAKPTKPAEPGKPTGTPTGEAGAENGAGEQEPGQKPSSGTEQGAGEHTTEPGDAAAAGQQGIASGEPDPTGHSAAH